MRFAHFDIETSGFSSTYNRVLCAAFKFEDETCVRSKNARWCKDEPALLKWITDCYNDCDVLVTWYGKMFDVPFVQGRLLQHGLPILDSKKMHIDALFQARKLRMTSCKLEAVSENFNVAPRKHNVPARAWTMACEGNRNAHREILKHCVHDVLVTEAVFAKLKPLVRRITA
jgi:uncharacterized protein YprB with RNaseH-like and TPR domain